MAPWELDPWELVMREGPSQEDLINDEFVPLENQFNLGVALSLLGRI